MLESMSSAPRPNKPGRIRTKKDKGFVLAFCALSVLMFLAFAGFSVDLGNWYLHIQTQQRAADAAALAGAAHLPGDPNGGVADSTQTAKDNGYMANPNTTLTVYPVPNSQFQMYVRVTQKVNNIFLGALGWKSITLSRVAVAEHRTSMLFGSPDNVLGGEPAGSDGTGAPVRWANPYFTGKQGNYFLQVSAPGSAKANGAEWTAGSCYPNQNLNTGNAVTRVAQGCTNGPAPLANTEFDKNGDQIIIHVPSGVSGTMAVDLFDASYVDTETDCIDTWMKSLPVVGNPNIYEFNPDGSATNSPPDIPAEAYCTGDREELNGTIPKAFNTDYWITTPVSDGEKPVGGCKQTYGGWEPQYDPLSDITAPTNGQKNDPNSIYNTFHKWARMCNFQVGGNKPTGDYILHVNVPYPQNGGIPVGTNDYLVRTAIMNGVGSGGESLDPQTNQISVYGGQNRLEATSVAFGVTAQYYIGKATPDLAGLTVKLKWFDIADNPMTLQVVPPRDATVNGVQLTSWSGCTQTGWDGTPPTQTASPPPGPIPGCTYSVGSRVYDGRWLEVDIPIPQGYSCGSDGLPDDCWFQAKQTYNNGNGHGIDDYWSLSSNLEQDILHIIH